MKKDFSQKIVSKIRDEKISPKSKWKLSWRNYLLWLILGVLVLVGSTAFSLTILHFIGVGPEVVTFLGLGRLIRTFFFALPYIWLGVLALSLVSGFLALRRTKHGYRYQTIFAVSVLVLLVFILGAAAHFFQVNSKISRQFSRQIPGYQKISPGPENFWKHPKEGLLGGEIIELKDQGFVLKDYRGEIWGVVITKKTRFAPPELQLEKGLQTRVVGEKIEEGKFEAFAVIKPRRQEVDEEQFMPKRRMPVEGETAPDL